MSRGRPDRLAAWATGVGVGFLTLMVAWLVGNRVAGLFWDAPVGPVVAMLVAVAAGALATVIVGRRLVRTIP
jgi:hypothetical protein